MKVAQQNGLILLTVQKKNEKSKKNGQDKFYK